MAGASKLSPEVGTVVELGQGCEALGQRNPFIGAVEGTLSDVVEDGWIGDDQRQERGACAPRAAASRSSFGVGRQTPLRDGFFISFEHAKPMVPLG